MDLQTAYQEKLANGMLKPDPGQAAVLRNLIALSQNLSAAPKRAKPGFLQKLFGQAKAQSIPGLYIHGAVGRGKTMLMDLFFESVPTQPKQRIHFHAFMQSVHQKRAKKSEHVSWRWA